MDAAACNTPSPPGVSTSCCFVSSSRQPTTGRRPGLLLCLRARGATTSEMRCRADACFVFLSLDVSNSLSVRTFPSPVSPRGGRPAGAGADSFTLHTFSAALLDCYSEYSYEHSLVRLSLVVDVATRKTRQRRRSGRVAVVACEAGQGPPTAAVPVLLLRGRAERDGSSQQRPCRDALGLARGLPRCRFD